jgi:hypothetical protein
LATARSSRTRSLTGHAAASAVTARASAPRGGIHRGKRGENVGKIMILQAQHDWLVVSTPLKNMKVSWDDYSQHMEK